MTTNATSSNYPVRPNPRNLHTVLPAGSTPLEHDLVDAYDAQIMPLLIPTLKDPDTCPEPLLAIMAYERNADAWSDAWPVATKRSMLKAARTIQARKGTVGAVRDVLKAMGQGAAVIVERIGGRRWDDGAAYDTNHQWDGSWATFAVQLSQPVTAAQGALIIDAINAAKRTSAHLLWLDMSANPLTWDANYCFDKGYTWDIISA